MGYEIKPIETVYKGYRFRSRLEARWAVFFDAQGIEWEYEPENREDCKNFGCSGCIYFSEIVKECGYHGYDFGFDYYECDYR